MWQSALRESVNVSSVDSLSSSSDLFANGPKRPPREDQHIQPFGSQITFRVEEIRVNVLDKHLPFEQVVVADRFWVFQ